jgi:molybdate transport system ATP-binding protein
MRLEARFSIHRESFHLESQLSMGLTGVTGLFGPSGSGKTTFLRCLVGLERSPQGYLRFGDQVWQDESQELFLPPYRRPVGMIFQESRLFDHLSVRDNLNFGRKRSPKGRRKISWQEVIEILELTPLLNRRPTGLSGGERQRVAIGRAILTSPELLIMDEPLASVDHEGKRRILGFIQQIQSRLKLPILHVSHDMGEIIQLADRLALMDKGKILATGPIHEMITRLDLPLAHRGDAGTVLTTQVTHQDPIYHLNHLSFGTPKQKLLVASNNLSLGETVRIRIFARDVSLALKNPGKTSILNIFPATVEEIIPENPAQYMVKLSLSGSPILARITKKSLETLAIKKGLSLIIQVKSVALER